MRINALKTQEIWQGVDNSSGLSSCKDQFALIFIAE